MSTAHSQLKIVSVWAVSFEDLFEKNFQRSELLSAGEQRRAAKFKHDPSRDRYVVARAFLRQILGEHLDLEPAKIEFKYNEFEKPYIDQGPFFNQSHSNSTLLVAVCDDCELGVDVEEINPDIVPWELAKTCFSNSEQKELARISDLQQAHQKFINGWTRKEAVIKALGGGFSVPLKEFSVSLSDGDEDALLDSNLKELDINTWRVMDLNLPGILSALALPHRYSKIQLMKPENY